MLCKQRGSGCNRMGEKTFAESRENHCQPDVARPEGPGGGGGGAQLDGTLYVHA